MPHTGARAKLSSFVIGEALTEVVSSPTVVASTPGLVRDPSRVLTLPAEIFDLIALSAAFIASLAVTPLLAFSYEDLGRADKRYFSYWANSTGDVVDSQAVSKGLSGYTSASLGLCVVSMIASLVVRMGFYFTDKLTADSAIAIRRRLIPLEVCSVLPLVTALIVVTFSFYWSGWVVYAENLAGTPNWFCPGIIVIVCLVLIFSYGAYVASHIYRNGVPANLSASTKPSQHPSTPSI